MHVLIVEDDPEINQLLCAYAQIAGFDPTSALDGHSAVSLASSQSFSLILLDVMLPDMGGIEVCQQLRRQPPSAGIPIIMLTALTAQATRDAASACGISAFLTKPFDPDELISAMQRHAQAT